MGTHPLMVREATAESTDGLRVRKIPTVASSLKEEVIHHRGHKSTCLTFLPHGPTPRPSITRHKERSEINRSKMSRNLVQKFRKTQQIMVSS